MNSFFAYMARMKYIQRWSLMRNTQIENIQEHSLQVGMIAHALALIANELFGEELNADRIMTLAVYHEASEVITGDLPTPIKYFNPKIRQEYGAIESVAEEKLLEMLPDALRPAYETIVAQEDGTEHDYVKAADKISAYLKCVEELKTGNKEFERASESIRRELERYEARIPAVKYFMETFEPSFHLTLDELN